jgi:hypothetical protein
MSDKRLPDEKATMTYVSSYYHTFSGAQKVTGHLVLLTALKASCRVTRKLSKNSPNSWKCSQNCSQNIKAQIESPKHLHLTMHLTAYLAQTVKDGQVKSSQTTKFRPIWSHCQWHSDTSPFSMGPVNMYRVTSVDFRRLPFWF